MPDILPTSSVPTSTFPYHELGPVDFSVLNFVETCETDNYYDLDGHLESVVRQCYNPIAAAWTIVGFVVIFLAALGYVMWATAKRSR